MRFRIQTNDYQYHEYETNVITSIIDFLIAIEDFDKITLSGTTYSMDAIIHVKEL